MKRLRQFNRTLAIFPHTRDFVASDENSDSSDAKTDDDEGSNGGSNDSTDIFGENEEAWGEGEVSGAMTGSGGRKMRRRRKKQWECQFDAEEILQIWARCAHLR